MIGKKINNYLKLLRVKHYIKNLLVFIPLFFSRDIFNKEKLYIALLGFVAFSLMSSAIYIINDYRDIEKDRLHPVKKNRPLASGSIDKTQALIVMSLCGIMSITIVGGCINEKSLIAIIVYFLLNILYSFGLKKKPIVDVVILASGFVIRVVFGGLINDIKISSFLFLVIVVGSLFMGLGKRRNEYRKQTDTRDVLKYYSESFLDKNMYVCMSLADVFYAMWAIEMDYRGLLWSIPYFIIILMTYSRNIEGESDGDPVEVILNDKLLVVLLIGYIVFVFICVYLL
ncbi:UbiA prenyltransferase family protein [Pseudobutyrivibrio ruminis]|uniref:UbiA prenyltransferase family protein n=1 Tax=Pseudobutyrivibrio ruminis TaxID=46206 RepID=UPI00056645ED|nr:UbiA prenyltransferase family protein [Pseudobutyrivibrio ruminis]